MMNLSKFSEAGKSGATVSFHRDDEACLTFRISQGECKQAAAAIELRNALADLEQFWEREGENSIDTFERVAEWFRRETGYLRPGKDCRQYDTEYREAIWESWRRSKLDRARAAIRDATVGEQG